VESDAELRQLVVDAGWNHRMYGATDEPVALQLAQCDGEHALADPVDLAPQLGEPQLPTVEQGDDQQRPLVGYPVEDLADLAVLARVPLVRVVEDAVGVVAVRR
jgi:hypothetical protein